MLDPPSAVEEPCGEGAPDPSTQRAAAAAVIACLSPQERVAFVLKDAFELSLDEIADTTRTVSDSLDESDLLGEQSYTLEVTSPGVSRPLTLPRHFQRNVGRLVVLTLADGGQVTGRIARAGAEDLPLSVPSTKRVPAREEQHPYAGIDRAEVQVEFSRKDSPTTPADDALDDEPSHDLEN